jgi:hypothetical protein
MGDLLFLEDNLLLEDLDCEEFAGGSFARQHHLDPVFREHRGQRSMGGEEGNRKE